MGCEKVHVRVYERRRTWVYESKPYSRLCGRASGILPAWAAQLNAISAIAGMPLTRERLL